ncbi:unnamed protein product [Cochlearia groenlandica]
MGLRRVLKSFEAVSTNGLIFSFTLLLALKLDHVFFHSWWFMFTPLWWLFHAVISNGRFSLPAPPMPDVHWAPFHSLMATPLLVAFEVLLCLYVQDKYGVDFKIIFLPLLVFEVAVLIFNLGMCVEFMPGDDPSIRYRTVPLFWVSVSTTIFITGITLGLLKLNGNVDALEWWDLVINFGIAECVAFLVCTTWSNQSFRLSSYFREPSASSLVVTYQGLDVTMYGENEKCGPVGRFAMKITFGSHAYATNIPVVALFSPLFLLQGLGVVFATLLCWWSTDEGSREEQAKLNTREAIGYNTFSPKIVEKKHKADLFIEEKGLCIVCYEDPIKVVLVPCGHLVLCRTCSEKITTCPNCRAEVKERVSVYT